MGKDGQDHVSIDHNRIQQARKIQRKNSTNINNSGANQASLRTAQPSQSRFTANGLNTSQPTYIKENTDVTQQSNEE